MLSRRVANGRADADTPADAGPSAQGSSTPAQPRRHRARHTLVDLAPVLMLVPAFLLSMILIASIDVDPFHALRLLFAGAFGSLNSLGVTAIKVTPLLITGLGVAVGIRAGMFNLGGDGQIYLGGLGASVAVLYLVPSAPPVVQVLLALLSGFIGGALWALVPALLRAFKGVTEVITTLLMTFIGVNVVTMLVQGPMGDPGASYPRSAAFPDGAALPKLIPGTQMHFGIILGLLLCVVVYYLIERVPFGLEIRAVGEGQKAARFTGVSVRKRLLQALMLSGALAGLAGSVEVLGLHHRLVSGFSPNYGFDAIAVAMLAASDPRWMFLSAVFFGALRAGAPVMERTLGVPSDLVFVTQGLAILAVVTGYALRAQLKKRLSLAA
jgi:simple sugar transport system permease protein